MKINILIIQVFLLLFIGFNGCATKNNNIGLIANKYQSLFRDYELLLIQTQKQLKILGENKKDLSNLQNELSLSKKLLNNINNNDKTMKKTLSEHIETINNKIRVINKSNSQVDFLKKALNYSQIVLDVLIFMEDFEFSSKYKNQFIKTDKNLNHKQAFESLENSYQLLVQQDNNSLEIDELFQNIKNKHKIFLERVSKFKKELAQIQITFEKKLEEAVNLSPVLIDKKEYLKKAIKVVKFMLDFS